MRLSEGFQKPVTASRTGPVRNNSSSLLSLGVQEVYRKGRRGYREAALHPSPEGLHEWRKQVKHLWFQTCVLNPLWPKTLDAQAFELNRIVGHLSSDRNLVLLRQNVEEQALSSSESEHVHIALDAIDVRRDEFQRKAIALGARVYFEKPRRFANRLESYWDAWRPEVVTSESNESSETNDKRASVTAS